MVALRVLIDFFLELLEGGVQTVRRQFWLLGAHGSKSLFADNASTTEEKVGAATAELKNWRVVESPGDLLDALMVG